MTELPRKMSNGILALMHAGDINRIVTDGLALNADGGFQGEPKGFAAPDLGAAAIRTAVEMRPEKSTRSSWAACCRCARLAHRHRDVRRLPTALSPDARNDGMRRSTSVR